MAKPFATLFFLAFLVWLIWAVVAGTPYERLNRGCMPIAWGGRLVSSVGGVFSANLESTLAGGTLSTFNNCKVVLFKQFFADDYAQIKAAAEAAKSAPAQNSKAK